MKIAIVIGLALVVGVFLLARHRRRADGQTCPKCGHRLPAVSSPRCPACGENI